MALKTARGRFTRMTNLLVEKLASVETFLVDPAVDSHRLSNLRDGLGHAWTNYTAAAEGLEELIAGDEAYHAEFIANSAIQELMKKNTGDAGDNLDIEIARRN